MCLLVSFASHAGEAKSAATSATSTAVGRPFTVEFYYRTQWGAAAEFIALYRKYHLPILLAQMESGRILGVSLHAPALHNGEGERWDLRATVTYRDANTAFAPFGASAIRATLFPDADAFERAERRRWDLVISHWDVAVEDLPILPGDTR
jgi:hypothetical protein